MVSHIFQKLTYPMRHFSTSRQYLLTPVFPMTAHALVLGLAALWPVVDADITPIFMTALMLAAYLLSARGPVVMSAVLCASFNAWDAHSRLNGFDRDDWVRAVGFVLVAVFMFEVNRTERDARQRAALRAQEALAVSQAKDRFLAAVSHDLRTPLAAIGIWIRLLRQQCKTEDHPILIQHVERATDAIENSTRHLRRLVDDLLDIARISAGKVQLQLRPLLLDNILGMACDNAAAAAHVRGVVFIPPPHTGVRIVADRDRLQQILGNLIINAIKFTERGGSVTVQTAIELEQVTIVITDTGRGIAPADLQKIFEPWWQREISGNSGGLGLGLTISKRLTELHGGSLTVSSDGLGTGAAFRVVLPRPAGNLDVLNEEPPAS